MARTDKDQFTHLVAGDSITGKFPCKRILVSCLGVTPGVQSINDGGAVLLFTIGALANTSYVIEGPFKLDNGITAPTNINLTLIR